MVADQSMVMQSWQLTVPGAIRAGQRAIHDIRMPPSVRSILPPTNGQLSQKRSPPLSLVKAISVLSGRPGTVLPRRRLLIGSSAVSCSRYC